MRKRLLRSRLLQALTACLLAVVMLGADDTEARFGRIGHMMVCQCGCGQILLECNHVGCPVSPVMISELRQQVATGVAESGVLNWFAAKYGAVVLAAPIRGGFDRVAWIMPLAVFLLATVGTALLVRVWTRRRGGAFQPASGGGVPTLEMDSLRERIRRETEL